MAKLTNRDLFRIWNGLDLSDYNEREVVDQLDTYCVQATYIYYLPEGTLFVTAQDTLPDSHFEAIDYAEIETPDKVFYDLTNTIAATRTAYDLRREGWKETHDTAGDLVLVRFSDPRVGYKPADGTLIIGYHEHPQKVYTYNELKKIIDK